MKPITIKLILIIPMIILSGFIFSQLILEDDIIFKILYVITGSFFIYESIRIAMIKTKNPPN
jgi:threonine/homoserine/homoserine lactone efflux protein